MTFSDKLTWPAQDLLSYRLKTIQDDSRPEYSEGLDEFLGDSSLKLVPSFESVRNAFQAMQELANKRRKVERVSRVGVARESYHDHLL